MRNCFFLPVFLLIGSSFFSINRYGPAVTLCAIQQANHSSEDTGLKNWLDDFRNFRDALYKNDTAVVKSFFKFPLLNKSNDIWYLVLTEKELNAKKTSAGKRTPFSEKDFHRYYKKIFPAVFIKSLLKIKTGQLYKTGSAESPGLKDGNATMVKIYASFDKKENTLTLNAAYNTVFKDEEGQTLDGGESNVIYIFRVQQNGHLQLLKIALAG